LPHKLNILSSLDDLGSLLEPNGLLAQYIPHFEMRPQQKEMLACIAQTFHSQSIAIIEAATGVGKSLCYLLAALTFANHTDQTVVISTHTLNLQDQLAKKELPVLLKALGMHIDIEIAKGMHNFLCLRKAHDLPQTNKQLEAFILTSNSGDLNELDLPQTEKTKLFCEQQACDQKRCPFFKECFFFQNKKNVQKAKLIITNHHLLLLDLKHKFLDDRPALLPTFEHLIIDEAHHLEDVATKVFSTHLDQKKCTLILKKLISKESKLFQLETKMLHHLEQSDQKTLFRRIDFSIKPGLNTLEFAFSALFSALQELTYNQKERIQEPSFFAPIEQELVAVQTPLKKLITDLEHLADEVKVFKIEDLTSIATDLLGIKEQLQSLFDEIEHLFYPQMDPEYVHYFEKYPLQFFSSPKKVDHFLKELICSKMKTLIFCSATLSSNQNFDFFKAQVGLEHFAPIECSLPSTFDFKQQVLLAIPNPFISPTHPHFIQEGVALTCQAIQQTNGKAFLLFTSFEMLDTFYAQIESLNLPYPLLKQGDLPKHKLLELFEQEENPVLFGTDSFWEGVDTKGHMRLLVITKLPFKVPTHPLFEARTQDLIDEGKDPFLTLAIPQAIVKLKQGFGRLVRSHQDKGSVLILDNRLLTKPYGKLFLNSLPPCTTCFDTKEVILKKI
jgi:ATP-dependent DNA helicase DinG